jgi:hypothetical protein
VSWVFFCRNICVPFSNPIENKMLLLDLLSIHMIRSTKGSTILTYHPDRDWCATTAQELYTRLKLVGRSVYWQNIFKNSVDPTFVFLALLWHALYAWDEALEILYEHFCWLVSFLFSHHWNRCIQLTCHALAGIASDSYQ